MLKLSTAATMAIVLLSCNAPQAMQLLPQPIHPSPTAPMTIYAVQTASITDVTLIARQEDLAPLGSQASPDRPVSFASIFLTLKNPSDRIQVLELTQVEVVAMDNRAVQLSSDEAQTIRLMPLENAVLDIQLNDPKDYATTGQVKAIITYRKGETVHRVESAAVDIR